MKTFDINNIQLKVQSPGTVVSIDLEKYIINQVEKLGKTFSRIKKCEMLLKVERNGRNKNFMVETKLFAPDTILFSKENEDNF